MRMGFAEVLTIIFVVSKLVGLIDWSWWFVLLPELIAIGIYLIVLFITLVAAIVGHVKVKKFYGRK
jgi:hypothetical protein